MSLPGQPPVPSALIVTRLGYVRLLYQQAVDMSQAVSPMDSTAVLMFHDAVENFFIVASDHLGTGVDLKQPFLTNLPKLVAPDGKQLDRVSGMRRLNDLRNAFKHYGTVPSRPSIDQARADATSFLDDNCPRIFGLTFDSISLIDIVPQAKVRAHLNSAHLASIEGDLREAMAEVAIGFHVLMQTWSSEKQVVGERSSFPLSGYHHRWPTWLQPSQRTRDIATDSVISELSSGIRDAFEETHRELDELREIVRIVLSGISMPRYTRFSMLAPTVNISFGSGELSAAHSLGELRYSEDNYRFCERFVVESALQLATDDFMLQLPKTFGEANEELAKLRGH